MKLERITTPGLAHVAYLISDNGQAAVVDPRRDIQEYLDVARNAGVNIKYVIETHRQEDFVSGAEALARATGAEIVTGSHPLFGHGDMRLEDGDIFELGELTIRALATPGHTPESMSYAVYAPQSPHTAWAVFTGDTLLYGTTGRSDLPDEDKATENAALLYDSVRSQLGTLADTALVLPAHGPGSVCGTGIAERPWSTIGDEKRYNEVFTLDRQTFAQKVGRQVLPRPPYFRHMEQVNLKGGLPMVLRPGELELLDLETFEANYDKKVVFDTRSPEAFAGGHIEGSYSIWLEGLAAYAGWFADQHTPVYLVTDRNADVDEAVVLASRIGIDNIEGALVDGFGSWRSSGNPIETSGVITARELSGAREQFELLDVRTLEEFKDGHIAGAQHMYVGHLADRIDELNLRRDLPVVVTCSVGRRGSLGVSILKREGFEDVRNLLGGMTAWTNLNLPVKMKQ